MSQFLPYGHQAIDKDDIDAVIRVLKADYIAQGPEVEKMENTICEITGAKYCVVVTSATAGLHIAVQALNLPKKSEGITSPITFLSSANCMVYNDVVPRFADIDPRTYCIDPAEIVKHITPHTRVLVPVDFAGQPADMKAIKKLADEQDLRVIEDAAHAIGSIYPDGKAVGSCEYSDMTVFSFHPVKTITTGEGGAITTNDKSCYDHLVLLRSHGMVRDPEQIPDYPGPWFYEMNELGFNYRMTDIQAALGNSQLKKLAQFKKRRREIVNKYNQAFCDNPYLTIPYETRGADSCFHLYVLLIDFKKLGKTRKQVIAEVNECGVGVQVHYIPVTYQPYYKTRFFTKRGDCPRADDYYDKALSIPLFPGLHEEDVQRVINTFNKVIC